MSRNAATVVLASLLGFAGLGSLFAGRLTCISRPVLLGLLAAIVGSIALQAFAFETILPFFLGSSFGLRVAVVVGILCPLGLALGTASPSGLRILGKNCPPLLPWGWAVNGFTSVLGSILCIVLGHEIGFTKVLWVAAGLYALGFLIVVPERRVPA